MVVSVGAASPPAGVSTGPWLYYICVLGAASQGHVAAPRGGRGARGASGAVELALRLFCGYQGGAQCSRPHRQAAQAAAADSPADAARRLRCSQAARQQPPHHLIVHQQLVRPSAAHSAGTGISHMGVMVHLTG